MQIKIALAGNPNSGKTTVFNDLTGSSQHVGNWPGVTVEKKDGRLKGNKEVIIQDLPGIYSLSPYTMEEVVSRNYLIDEKPDAIINVVDASNIERNLYLTTQLTEIGIPVVIALNMIDLVQKKGDVIDLAALGEMFGCEVLETSATKGLGTKVVAEKAVALAQKNKAFSAVHRFSPEVEAALEKISALVAGQIEPEYLRWYTVKFFERDAVAMKNKPLSDDLILQIEQIIKDCETALDDDSESIITNERYLYIEKVIQKAVKVKKTGLSTSDKIDRIVTNRWLALPIFAAVMFLVYFLSINTVGGWMTDWINDVLFGEIVPTTFGGWLAGLGIQPWLFSLIMDGIVSGVGAVLGFLPQMLVLFLLLAVLEDCGYMARIAFVLDRLFRKFGLSGKSFIPMLISTGCAVPGIMASRTIENESDRRMTVITTSFMPCSAKLPIIALISGALFGDAVWVAPSAYFLGMAAIIVSGTILKKTKLFAGDTSPFVMELPAYHLPRPLGVLRTMLERGLSFIKKAGTLVLLSTVLIWFLGSFSWSMQMVDTNHSILASIGRAIAPIFTPLGWGDWRAAVASLSGLLAKENIVGTLGVLFGLSEVAENGAEFWPQFAAAFSALAGYSLLVFNLLCAPCFAAIGALRREMVSGKWTLFAITYQCVFAYCVSLILFQLGTFFGGGAFGVGTAIAFLLVALFVFLLVRKPYEKKALVYGGAPKDNTTY